MSLFGGGTDYPEYFKRFPGAVIGFAINKYIYVSVLGLGAYVDYRYRISYSKLEHTDSINAIEHPVVNAVLRYCDWDAPLDISTQADLPASAGLGSSSAFTVGFTHIISLLKGIPTTRMELARKAIYVEHDLLHENVGVQDQLHAAIGGMNRFDFHDDCYRITPLSMPAVSMNRMCDWFVLVYTGIKRRASDVVSEQVNNTSTKRIDKELVSMYNLVNEAQKILEGSAPIDSIVQDIAALLKESWALKKKLSSGVTKSEIDQLYDFCIEHGAIGGKLCGAGGGGFLLMVVSPEKRKNLISAVGERRCISVQIDQLGSHVISGQLQGDAM